MADRMPRRAAQTASIQYPGGDLSRPANPQARLSALRVIYGEAHLFSQPGSKLVTPPLPAQRTQRLTRTRPRKTCAGRLAPLSKCCAAGQRIVRKSGVFRVGTSRA